MSSSVPANIQELLTTTASQFQEHAPELLLYLHIILAALFPIYTGAHASLSRPSSAAKPVKEQGKTSSEDEEEETTQIMEGLSASDAVVFPVTAGLVLATLYWLIKRYGADVINLIMAWYFAGTGIFSVAKLFSDTSKFILSFVFPAYYQDQGRLYEVRSTERRVVSRTQNTHRPSPLPGMFGRLPLPAALQHGLWKLTASLKQKYTFEAYVWILLDLKSHFNLIDFAGMLVGIAAVAYNSFVAKPWWLTNVQGFAVSYFALQLISPTSFAIGSLVLCGLFFYDIWAVFFTPLMVTVATKLDQPIKLLFPRPDAESAKMAYSMLGLGDIVLPGLMVGLALRFDLFLYYARKQTKSKDSSQMVKATYTAVKGHWGSLFWTSRLEKDSMPVVLLNAAFPKPYFTAAMFGYVAGMITTLAVMSVFQHAQPALLYLVPAVLSSIWGTATIRGDLKAMWDYSEELTGEALAEALKDDKSKAVESDVAAEKSWWQTVTQWLLWDDSARKSDSDAVKDSSAQSGTDAGLKAEKNEEHLTAAATEPGMVFSVSVRRRILPVERDVAQEQRAKDKKVPVEQK